MATSSNASASIDGSESGGFPVANNPAIASQVLAAARVTPPPLDDDAKKPL